MKLFRKLGSPAQSWITPKAYKGPSRIAGTGLIAREPISKNELVVVKAGRIMNKQILDDNEKIVSGAEAQIYDDLFIAPLTKTEFDASMARMNHSCEPNVGFGGNILVVAIRDIKAGEELTLDYAMMRSDEGYTLECNCRSKSCRKRVTGNDWMLPDLQKKYSGYFQWYIEQKIKSRAQNT